MGRDKDLCHATDGEPPMQDIVAKRNQGAASSDIRS
jgi:hypothetical protein